MSMAASLPDEPSPVRMTMTNLRIGVNTIGFMWDRNFQDAAARLIDRGYRHFDAMLSPGHLDVDHDAGQRTRLRQFLAANGAVLECITTPSIDHNLASSRAEVRQTGVALYRSVIDLASDLDARSIIVVAGRVSGLNPPPATELNLWMRDSLDQLVRHAERKSVRLLLENVPISLLPRAPEIRAIWNEIDSPALGVCYDVANACAIGEDIAAAVAVLGPSLCMAHLSDTPADSWRHDPIGTGVVDFAGFCRALVEQSFAGVSMIEVVSPKDPFATVADAHEQLSAYGWAAPSAEPIEKGN